MQARRGNNLINQEMAIIEMTHFESKVWTQNKSNSYKTKYFFHLFNENNIYTINTLKTQTKVINIFWN